MKVTYSKSGSSNIKAKTKRIWHGEMNRSLLKVLIGSTFVAGVAAWYVMGQQWAWVLAISAAAYVFFEWLTNEAMQEQGTLATSNDEELKLNDALSADILGNLKDPYSFEGIWAAAKKSPRAIFMINRFGLASFMFEREANDDKVAERVWTEAYTLAKKAGVERITGAEVLVALVSEIPSAQQILAHSHIEYKDLVDGLGWIHHIIAIQKKYEDETFIGGIARDWTAGYTPTLSKIAVNISEQIQKGGGIMHRDIDAHGEVVQQMFRAFDSGVNNITLIGDIGVGKTTTVNSFAQHLITDPAAPKSLRYNQVFRLDAANLKSNMSNYGAEELMTIIFNEAMSAQNVILFIDDAHLFFTYDIGAIDISKLLLQILERSNVRIIMSMTATDWQNIQQENAALAGLVNQINVSEPDRDDVIKILEDQVLIIESKNKTYFTYQALVEAYRLAGHYVTDLAFPAKAVKVLEAAARFEDDGAYTEKSVQQAVESMVGVKVQTVNKEETSKLLNLEEEIHGRMINQSRAVNVVSNALRRARSGVNNPDRPIGTFLFLGPTGVGKTELSKAIADVYFGDDENMIRVDMNQANSDDALNRDMLSKIKIQPFSVVLLDEIEKASTHQLDTLLQMLDEGFMRDDKNNKVSFKDAIIIATSNAGADEIRKKIAEGKQLEEFEEEFINNLIDSGAFKPEFINRFDETVLFRPLNKEELLQVVDILLKGVNKNLARQKVSVTLDQESKLWLVDKGYDERLGARPLRRVIQRTVENIVAKKILDSSFNPGDELNLTVQDLEQEVV